MGGSPELRLSAKNTQFNEKKCREMEGATADSPDPSGASEEQWRRRGARWVAMVATVLGRNVAAACLGEETRYGMG